jgi:group II intron reverse transcriptase/maturase
LGNLTTPNSVQKLQKALQAKAKESPEFRFYALYDKVYRADVLQFAYACCKANHGAAGVDEERFEDIQAYGEVRWLGELAQALRQKKYRAQAVRRVYIPKPNGKLRPLGIPTIRDRVVQTAAMLILESIFEIDLLPEQYAYRSDRSALDAVREVHRLLNFGHREVIDADLSDYFGSIPRAELLKCVARRVIDRQMLHLIKMWQAAGIEETDRRGRRQRTKGNNQRGIPQGAPISPLLSSLYMRRFVLGWKRLGHERKFGASIVNYADDLVICCHHGAEEALMAMRQIMQKLKLTVNEEKTRVCRVPQEHFDFLGYTFGRCYSHKTGRAYLGTRPSRKSVRRLKRAISEATNKRTLLIDFDDVVAHVNRVARGWANYFCLGPVSKTYNGIDRHTTRRIRRWIFLKHKKKCMPPHPRTLHKRMGLIWLCGLTKNFPWAKT